MAYAVHTRSCTYLLDDDGVCHWTLAPTGVPAPGAERFLGAQFVACLDVREAGGLVGELRVGAAALFARSENGRLVLLRTPLIDFVEHREDEAASAAAEPIPQYTPYEEPLPAYAPRPTAAPPGYAAPAPSTAAPAYAAPPPAAPSPVYAAPAPAVPSYVAPMPVPVYRAPAPAAPVYRAPAAPPYTPSYEQPASVATAPLPWPAAAPPAWAPAAAPAYAVEPEIDLDDEDLDVEELVTFTEVTLTMPLYRPESQPPPLPRRGVIGPGRRLR